MDGGIRKKDFFYLIVFKNRGIEKLAAISFRKLGGKKKESTLLDKKVVLFLLKKIELYLTTNMREKCGGRRNAVRKN